MTQPLEEIQDSILERLHAGEPVDREAALAAHPEHAQALARFFSVLDVIETAPQPEAPVPSRLGEFVIVREIGRGGMGVVYEAEQASLKRRVALKILPSRMRGDPQLLARFRREAEAAGSLRHPGIVPVFSVGEQAGTPFFAMELVEGRSLAEILCARRAGEHDGLPAPGESWRHWALETIARVADALGYAHGRGILHRDVKPSNILVEADGTPRLTDFGLALDLTASALTVSGEVFGSPHYMSPEQLFRREAPLDERTDVYSLAVTLYELLTLRLPYEATTGAELLGALSDERVVPPRRVDPQISAQLEMVLLRALRKDPRERYASAAAFAQDLRAVLEDRPPAARPRRRRAVLAGAAAVVVVLAAAAALRGPGLLRGEGFGAASLPGHPGAWTPPDAELGRIARGLHPDAAGAMLRWIQPEIRLRHVLARADPGRYECAVTFPLTRTLESRYAVRVDWEVAVNGDEFRPLFEDQVSFAELSGGPGGLALPVSVRPNDVLGEALAADHATLRHRATVRLWPWDDAAPRAEIAAAAGSIACQWTSAQEGVLLYDDYPADYPEAVRGANVDAAMRQSLTPQSTRVPGISIHGRSVQLTLGFGPAGPVPAACEVDVILPRSGRTLGSFEHARPAQVGNVNSGLSTGLIVALSEQPSEDEQRLLLDLEAGRTRTVRMEFRASRRVALDQPGFDRYWGGTHQTEVQLTRQP